MAHNHIESQRYAEAHWDEQGIRTLGGQGCIYRQGSQGCPLHFRKSVLVSESF